MSWDKKVIFLILLLIIFIIACVYTHAPKLAKKIEQTAPIEVEKVETKKEEKNLVIEPLEENNNIQEEINNNQPKENETVLPQALPFEEPKEETVLIENKEPETSKVVEEPVLEEKVIEPLITTGAKYIREGDEKRIEQLSLDTQKLQLEINEYIKENPVIFKRAGYKTTKESNLIIKHIADILKQNPNIKIEIAGHTDAAGAAKMNEEISLARAQSVRNKLVSYGISSKRLMARGYGESIPLVKNNSQGYSKINRRVEFNIVEE